MFKETYLLIFFFFIVSYSYCQSITISDTANASNGLGTPYDASNDYHYGQAIYLKNEIQGTGTVIGLTYYYLGTKLTNSDSITVYMKNSGKKFFSGDGIFLDINTFQKVFNGKINYTTIPGPVNITLNQPFSYNSDSNLIIAVNEQQTGNDYVNASIPTWFDGFYRNYNGNDRVLSIYDLNPLDPFVVQNKPPFSYIYSGSGLANVTLHGLTPLPCQSPKKVRFTNINHNNVKVVWSAPSVGNTPAGYDLYFSTDQTDPTAATIISFTNITDTFKVITGLQPTTNYKVWLRSSCGTSLKSVWTLVDSFTTICAPTPIPTPAEPFNVWLPNCWRTAEGSLQSNVSQLTYAAYTASQYWAWREWRNVTGSGNKAANVALSGGKYYWLISPPYELGNSGNKSLEFDIALTKNYNVQQTTLDNDDTVSVVISTDNGTTWSRAGVLRSWTASQTISFTGQHVIIPLSNYNGAVRIGFYGSSLTYNGTVANIPRIFIDNVQITGVMPVTLLSFTGRRSSLSFGEGRGEVVNLLQWRTATEQNNRGFELQRSANGIDFSSIAFVPTKANGGNSNAEVSYQFVDKRPMAAGGYYRLKQVDFDGKFTYSSIVFIKGEPVTELSISSLYPNPAQSQLNVLLQSPAAQKVQLIITDLAGKIVQLQTLQLQKGDNNKTVNVAALAKGIYVVKVICGKGCEAAVNKFVKE